MSQAVHGKAINLFDPDLKLLGSAELVQLVGRIDLAKETAEFMVAAIILESHL